MTRILCIALGIVLLVGAIVGSLWYQAHRITTLNGQLSTAQQAQGILADRLATSERAVTVVTQYVDRVQVVHEKGATITREIPIYVTPQTDAAFPLPVGFVRVHDAAAQGVPLGGPGPTDAQASGIKASLAASVVADNYTNCLAITAQLTALQDFVRDPDDAKAK